MVDYNAIDAILMPWAAKHDQHVRVRDRDTPLRSIIIYIWRGTRHESGGHLWLEGPDAQGRITVHAAAPDWHREKTVFLAELESALEETYQTMIARLDNDEAQT